MLHDTYLVSLKTKIQGNQVLTAIKASSLVRELNHYFIKEFSLLNEAKCKQIIVCVLCMTKITTIITILTT